VGFKIKMLDKNGVLMTADPYATKEHNFSENSNESRIIYSWHYTDALKHHSVMTTEWINRKLEFVVKFESFQMKMVEVFPVKIAPFSTDTQVNSNMWAYNDYKLRDAWLIVCEERIPVHKLILSMRSEIFRNIFLSGMSESNSNEIIINDFDVKTVKSLLQFIYTNTCDENQLNINVFEIWKIANKYLISDLENVCIKHIIEKLSNNENVFDFLLFADLYGIEYLKSKCVQLIHRNNLNYTCLKELNNELYLELFAQFDPYDLN
jgi:hypothetical protein